MALPTDNQETEHRGVTPPAPSPRGGASVPLSSSTPITSSPPQQTTRPVMSIPTGGHVAIRPLRTYKDDLAEAIKKGGYSTASIQEAERKKKAGLPQSVPPLKERRPAPVQHTFTKPIPQAEHLAPRVTPPQKPLPPQPLPSSPEPIQTPPVSSQRSGEERKTFFSQLLGLKKEMGEKKLEEKPITPHPSHQEIPIVKPAFVPAPVKIQTPPPAPIIPVPAKAPVPTKQQVAHSHEEVRFIEEHAIEKKSSPSILPSWAVPGETAVEHRAEMAAREEKLQPVASLFRPRLPFISHEAPTRGSAISEDAPAFLFVRSTAIALLSVIAILGIGFGGYTFFQNSVINGESEKIIKSSSQFIPITNAVVLDVTNFSERAFIEAYKTKVQESIPPQSTRGIIASIKESAGEGKEITRALRTSEFFARATPVAPGTFVRALGDTFTFGVYGSVGGNSGFIISSVENYDRALGGLLSWEYKMGPDIAPFLFSKASHGRAFTDKTIAGVATRVLGSGESALVYGFIDKKVLLIARGEGVFGALADMIRAQK